MEDMDSDVTADSLSSPERGATSTQGRDSAFGSMLSFSNQGPPGRASSQRSSSAALDSFDLSPATDASTGGGGFLDGGSSRHQRSSSSLHQAGELTPLSESRRSSDLLSREDEEDSTDKHPRYGNTTRSVREERGVPQARGEVAVGMAPRDGRRGGAEKTRKRSREVATIDGRASMGWQPPQHHRLERSWPLFHEEGAGGDGSNWGMSESSPSASRSFSRRGETPSPREYTSGSSVPRESRSHQRERLGTEASVGGFSRGGESNEGEGDGGRDGGLGGGGGGINSNRGMSVSSSDGPLSGGIGETFSVFSEVSSRGLPAPPPMPSGPLPVIGTIREVRRCV